MRGLTCLLAADDGARLRAALSVAAAAAALGGRARIFLHERAVAMLARPLTDAADADAAAHGLPMLAETFDLACGVGVSVIACQTGLAWAGIDAARLDSRIEIDGLVSILASLGEDRLLAM